MLPITTKATIRHNGGSVERMNISPIVGDFLLCILEARAVASVVPDQLVGVMGLELFPSLGSKTVEGNAVVEVSEAWQLTRQDSP